MPTYVNSLRNVLDADANVTTVNTNAYLYSTIPEAINAGDQLFIISEYATRLRKVYVELLNYSEEEAGNTITGSLQDSLGNYPDPTGQFFSAGVQIDFQVPQGNFASPFPLGTYGIQGGLVSGVGLRHYHHQIQYGLNIDGNYYNGGGGFLIVDYMEDAFTTNGTIIQAGEGAGTWDQNNISLGNLRGVHKPVTSIGGNSGGLGGSVWNVIVGDPSGVQTGTGFGAGEVTGHFTEDGIDKMLANSTSAPNISIGGFGDGI